jgi:Acetyltransferase (GNAT) domain
LQDRAGSAVVGEAWERGSVPLKFQLSDFVLGSVHLSLYRRSARPDERPLDIDEIPEPPPHLDEADGYVVWSRPIAGPRPALSLRRRTIIYTPRQYRRFSAGLSGDFEQYMSHFSPKTRSTLRRKLRKFAEASGGVIDWREYRSSAEIAKFFPLAHKVSTKTYQERLLDMGLPGDSVFFDSAIELSRQDRVRAYLLFLNREPISYLYCPIIDGVVVYDHLGYDPAHASLSPGTVMQILALQALFAERRFTLFDFTEGEGQHKEVFSTQSVQCGDLFVIKRRLGLLSVVMLHRVVDEASGTVGRVLNHFGLKSRLKRLLRRR